MKMSTKHQNPYRAGSNYAKLFAFVQGKQVATIAQVEAYGISIGMTQSETEASTSVILSKTKKGFGNRSAGKGYYMENLKKEKVGDELRKRLRWYAKGEVQPERPPRNIKPVAVIASEKIAVKATVKPVKAATKGKVTA